MKYLKNIILIVIALSFASCEKVAMHSKPGTDNLSIFNEYSKICIEKFGLEKVKGIDLIALSDSLKPYITDELNQKELFDYMGILTTRMQYCHTNLESINDYY